MNRLEKISAGILEAIKTKELSDTPLVCLAKHIDQNYVARKAPKVMKISCKDGTQKATILRKLVTHPDKWFKASDFQKRFSFTMQFVGYEAGTRLGDIERAGYLNTSTEYREGKPNFTLYKIKPEVIKIVRDALKNETYLTLIK